MEQNRDTEYISNPGAEVSYGEEPSAQESGVQSNVEVYYTENGIPVGASYFKGVGFERHAEADVTKGESAFIWIMFALGVVVGAFFCWKVSVFIGVFFGIVIAVMGMLGVGARAFIRQGDRENLKTMLLVLVIFGGVFLFIGAVFIGLFMAGVA